MKKLVVTPEMLQTRDSLNKLYVELNSIFLDVNNNLDNVISNWTGKKAKTTLEPIEDIKKINLQVLEKINKKADEVEKAYQIYAEYSETIIKEESSAVVEEDTSTVIVPSEDNVEQAEDTSTVIVPSEDNIEQAEDTSTVIVPSEDNVEQAEDTSTVIVPSEDNVEKVEDTPAVTVPSGEAIERLKVQTVISNNIYDLPNNGEHSRVITYQGAQWNYFNMSDPEWRDWNFDRNSAGFKPLENNGTHPFATINIMVNSGLMAGNKKDVVIDVLGVSGKKLIVDGKTTGDNVINLTTGPAKVGTGNKYKMILNKAGIPSSDLGSLNNAIGELENGNIVHCIAQEGSTMAKYGHYLNLVGVEKDKSGDVTALYVLDSKGRTQAEYESISSKNSNFIDVIEPGLVRVDASKDSLNNVRLASFRSITGGQSQTKTVFSYEEYINNK